MNENVENLVLEHLRVIRADIHAMKDDMSGVRAEIPIIRQHMAGLLGSQTLQDAEIAGLKARIDRLERRLELTDV